MGTEKVRNEILKKGYIIVSEYNNGMSKYPNLWEYTITVWKDGFYGVINGITGEELTPCVHLSELDANRDILRFEKHFRMPEVGLQKILKESMSDDQYNPYIGATVRLLFEVLALPNGATHSNDYRINLKQCRIVAKSIYQLVERIMNAGGKRFKIYDHNITTEFQEFIDELEKLSNIEYDEELDNYISISPELCQRIEYLQFRSNPFALDAGETRKIAALTLQKPVLEISAEGTIYYPDISSPERESSKTVILAEPYQKGISLNMPDGSSKSVR